MSPAAKKALLPVGVLISTALAIGAWAIRSGAQVVDHRYVHADTFTVYRADERLWHTRDSLIHEAREARMDTALNTLVRACQRQRACP